MMSAVGELSRSLPCCCYSANLLRTLQPALHKEETERVASWHGETTKQFQAYFSLISQFSNVSMHTKRKESLNYRNTNFRKPKNIEKLVTFCARSCFSQQDSPHTRSVLLTEKNFGKIRIEFSWKLHFVNTHNRNYWIHELPPIIATVRGRRCEIWIKIYKTGVNFVWAFVLRVSRNINKAVLSFWNFY